MNILVAEDDPETAAFLCRGLGDAGHQVHHVETGAEALAALQSGSFDIAVLDRMLPGLDGLSVIRGARRGGIVTPALMLTALGQIEDRVDGLEAGADDYLVKPFAMSELVARLNAISRRRQTGDAVTTLTAGSIVLDLLHRETRISGRLVPLQPREFRLLEELVRNAGRVVTRTMLLESVWNFHFEPQTNLVETHMSHLRAKLAAGGAPAVIETVRGAGYRMVADA